MTKKFHIALEVTDLALSIEDYSKRLGCKPEIIIENEYAVWRTDLLNFSIRIGTNAGKLRHLGFEDSEAAFFTTSTDVNGLLWEQFSDSQQRLEIENLWGKQPA